MAIHAKTEYDQSTSRVYGKVTLPGHSGIATHALVFMLSGICKRWKQTVAYYYTGNYPNNVLEECFILVDLLVQL